LADDLADLGLLDEGLLVEGLLDEGLAERGMAASRASFNSVRHRPAFDRATQYWRAFDGHQRSAILDPRMRGDDELPSQNASSITRS
jgi:hypothetical protein